ncbi:insulinase family protein [Agrobacterium rhizogenes]|nr:insulinase family protein [Rhizobium rhizogenes]NTG28911.1 insulinase family protein [Rhizobium rhizogenes]NTG35854.1 insulinase family protein [Rhizobium rhizogenes]NTG55104.1 insulinase family protein [Rhizobium rhizogenes]NTH00765.1 insulinase family protein [Rhizobium rhizogenes]
MHRIIEALLKTEASMSRQVPVAAAFLRFFMVMALTVLVTGALPAQAEVPASGWPQATSDLPAESGVRFGTLPNGMRFAVMHNATPSGQVAIRFRIATGSLQENDDQQGLAHFLEHMAFKGSTHVPEGEMIRTLQRLGLAFGPDTNASTGYNETVYALDLPEAKPDTVSTGLMLMRETASELTLDAGAFDRERGVILSEEKLRDTPQYRGGIGFMNLLLPGQRVPLRSPIGKTDIIRNAPVDLVRDYYRSNYRPDRATLIVVGDIDAVAIEADIRNRFGNWTAATPAPAEPDIGVLEKQGQRVGAVVVPGGATRVQIAWTSPYDASPDSVAKRRADLVENIGLAVLNRRLSFLAQQPNPPFVSAQAGSQDLYKSAHVAMIAADSDPDKWQAALVAIDQEQRRIAQFGAEQSEIDREITEYRSMLQAAAGGAATRASPDIATTLAWSTGENLVFTSPAGDLSLFDAAMKGLTADEVNRTLQSVFAGNGPLLVLQVPQMPDGGIATVEKAYADSRTVPVAAPEHAASAVWPYSDFGPPGSVVEQHAVEDLGITMARFANGVRLTVKPTTFRTNEVLVRANIGRGRLDLPHDRPLPIWAAPAMSLSGLKAINYDDMQKALAGNVVGNDFSIQDGAFRFEGATRPDDLAMQLQLLTAYASDPAYRPDVFKRVQQAYLNSLPQLQATPGGVVSRDLAGLLHSDDPRWTFPDQAQLRDAKPEDFEGLLRPLLSNAQIEIIIVGDIKVDDAIRMTAQTFGALPSRPDAQEQASGSNVRFPAPTPQPVERLQDGRSDNAAAVVAAPIGDFLSDLPRAAAANVTGSIFQNRLVDQFRVAEGATYSPQGDVDLSRSIPGYGFTYVYVETTPAKVDHFFDLVDKIAADLRDSDVSLDELTRAKAPMIEEIKRSQQTNGYWLEGLHGAQTDPRRLERIRSSINGYQSITAQDIRAIATTYLKPETFWRMKILPSNGSAVR